MPLRPACRRSRCARMASRHSTAAMRSPSASRQTICTSSTQPAQPSPGPDQTRSQIQVKALTYGRFRGLDGNAALFDLATGPAAAPLASLRISILERDIGRVTMQRPGGYRLDRGWAIAPDRAEPPFEGRPRDDISGFANPKLSAAEAGGIVTLAVDGLSARVQLDPFGIAWHRDGEEQPFLRDRPTQAYLLSRKT